MAFNPRTLTALVANRALDGGFNLQFLRCVLRLRREANATMLFHQCWKDVFRVASTDQKSSTPLFNGSLKVSDALKEKTRAERARLDVTPTILCPKPIVKHDHRYSFFAAHGFGEGRIVV